MKDKIENLIEWVKSNKTEAWCIFAIALGAMTLIGLYPDLSAGLISGVIIGWNKGWLIEKAKDL